MLEFAQRVKTNLQFLQQLSQTKTPPELLKKATDDQILTIVEICHNLIKFRFHLNTKQLQSLRKFAVHIRFISRIRNRAQAEQTLTSLPPIFFTRLLQPLFHNYK
jgi:hypothetical protein